MRVDQLHGFTQSTPLPVATKETPLHPGTGRRRVLFWAIRNRQRKLRAETIPQTEAIDVIYDPIDGLSEGSLARWQARYHRTLRQP
jgi:hypothetical protein